MAVADPLPVVLPRDDGPHDRLTEWWYYTGHLAGSAADGPRREFGFEFVIFRAERGSFPTTWASHLAITDETGDRFVYSQRLEVGEAVDRSPRDAEGTPTGFDLSLTGIDPADASTFDRPAWGMSGSGGRDELHASAVGGRSRGRGEPGRPRSATSSRGHASRRRSTTATAGSISGRPAARTTTRARRWTPPARSPSTGRSIPVTGTAWFDHQWGDFISVGGGGWDWFAVNLDDGTDLTLSLVRDADGSYPLVYGTVVDPDGTTRHLDRDAFTVEVTDRWTSPATGRRVPGRLDDRDPRRGRPHASSFARRSPRRSSTRAPPPGSSTGRARRSSGARARACRSAARRTWS